MITAATEAAVDALLEERGWAQLGPARPHGDGVALELAPPEASSQEPGTLYTLYCWPQYPELAEALAWVHDVERAGKLAQFGRCLDAGPGWAVLRQRRGVRLSEIVGSLSRLSVHLGAERARDLTQQIGRALRQLHEVGVAQYFGSPVARTWQTFTGYVAARLEHYSEQVNQRSFGEQARQALLRDLGDLRHELSAFYPRQPAAINHGALGARDVLVDPRTHEVVCITGFAHAVVRPPEADVAHLLFIAGLGRDDQLIRAFYHGYSAARTMDVQRRERFYRRLAAFEALTSPNPTLGHDLDELARLTRR